MLAITDDFDMLQAWVYVCTLFTYFDFQISKIYINVLYNLQ